MPVTTQSTRQPNCQCPELVPGRAATSRRKLPQGLRMLEAYAEGRDARMCLNEGRTACDSR
eukprot:6202619-Pleurochrysis_carterae.AAC.2